MKLKFDTIISIGILAALILFTFLLKIVGANFEWKKILIVNGMSFYIILYFLFNSFPKGHLLKNIFNIIFSLTLSAFITTVGVKAIINEKFTFRSTSYYGGEAIFYGIIFLIGGVSFLVIIYAILRYWQDM